MSRSRSEAESHGSVKDIRLPIRTKDDGLTLVAIGAAAASLAAVSHEVIGHGIGCIAMGGHITLLTSIFFRCFGATALTDAAGPIGNIVVGIAAFALLRLSQKRPVAFRLFLVLVAALNIYWFTGQMIYAGVLSTEDQAYVARDLSWPNTWRLWSVLIGCFVYVLVGTYLVRELRALAEPGGSRTNLFRRIGIPYAAGAISAALAGLLWAKNPWISAELGILAVGVAPLPLLFAARRAGPVDSEAADSVSIERSWVWIVAGLGIYVAFALIEGRGLGRLA